MSRRRTRHSHLKAAEAEDEAAETAEEAASAAEVEDGEVEDELEDGLALDAVLATELLTMVSSR